MTYEYKEVYEDSLNKLIKYINTLANKQAWKLHTIIEDKQSNTYTAILERQIFE